MNPNDFVVLTPQGRLDAAGTRPFEEEWKRHIAAGHTRILVDLTETRYVSSNGLRTLLAAARTAKKHGGVVKLCCLSSRLLDIFEMAGFDRVFEVYPTREKAIQSFSE